jgi:DeoR/GlpR family transcriptional regulator of sugar metabolism
VKAKATTHVGGILGDELPDIVLPMTEGQAPAVHNTEPAGRGQADRREYVRRQVVRRGFVRIDDLTSSLGVSAMTIHRDLDALEAEGWLTKIRGGATANPSALMEASVRERSAALSAEKEAIAACAAELLTPGQTVFVDDSTTAMGLLPHLVATAPVTVATNFFPLVTALSASKGVDVIALGGRYYPLQEACFGLQTADAIRRLHADILFMSTTGVSNGACYHRSEATVMVKRAFMEHATRTVLLVDHAKFGRPAPHLLAALRDFDLVVTDDGASEDDVSALRQQGATVHVAQVAQ